MSLSSKLEPVQKKIQKAITLELATIPPYLTAMFSVKPGYNQEAVSIIRSVFMEEMLHMTLACNLLVATGGKVHFSKKNVPIYPLKLEFKDRQFDINLAGLTKENIKTFMDIEMPEGWEEPLKPRGIEHVQLEGDTIGEFYEGIKMDLLKLCSEYGEEAVFSGSTEHQIGEDYYWSGGGKPIVITNLTTASEAIDVIVEQGEGVPSESILAGDQAFFSQEEEIAHFFRFREIYVGRRYKTTDLPEEEPSGEPLHIDYSQVYPIKQNCKQEDLSGYLKELNQQFNETYSLMLLQIRDAFNGYPKLLYTAIMNGMHKLTPIAQEMVQIPIKKNTKTEDGATEIIEHGAPSFEWRKPSLVD